MLVDYPIFGDYGKRPAVNFSSEDLINLYLINDPAGKKKYAFLSTPGLMHPKIVNTSTSESRALYVYQGVMYGVFGADIYKFSSTLVPIYIGSIGTSAGFVSITANNANQIIFVDGVSGYIYNTSTNVFAKITDSGFPPKPLNVAFLDGYFAIQLGESSYFQLCALNDGTKWDALDAAQIQAYPGNNVGVGVVNRRLYFFKDTSTEVWYNQGAADFPFRRDNNLLFNYGCMTAASIVSEFGYLCWLSKDKDGVGSVMITDGQNVSPLSDDAIDEFISSFTDPSDMNAFIYKDGDHIFYVMNFNTDDETLVCEIKMKTWHKRQMHQTIPNGGRGPIGKKRNLPNCHAYFNNIHYVGSYKAPILYNMSRDAATNAGEPIERSRVPKHFFDEGYRRLQTKAIQIDMQMGLGDATGDFQDPQVYIRVSNDGGNSYGNMRAASVGKIGQTRVRAKFRKFSITRNLVTKIIFNSPVAPFMVLGAAIDYEVLRS